MTSLLNLHKHKQHRIITLLFFAAFFSFSTILVTSCKKTPSQLGADLLPDSTLKVYYSDTANIIAYSAPIDTTRADELTKTYIGSIIDPVFGQTQSSLYTKIIQSTVGHRFGTNPKLDSLVLQLTYADVYGDTTTTLKLHVYELLDNIAYDSIYYSNHEVQTSQADLANFSFQPQPHQKHIFNDDTIKNVLRIRLSDLSDDLGYKLLHADSTILDSNELFMNYFKGLYLTTDEVNNGGALASFTTNASTTILTIYYSNDENDSLRYAYTISSAMARISRYEHDFSKGSQTFISQVVNHDTTLGREQFYVQGLAGVKTIIRFPDIKKFARLGKIGVNEAKLFLPGIDSTAYLGAPEKLSLIRIASDSTYTVLDDDNEGSDYFGGSYNAVNNSYEFRITHYIQSLIQDTTQANYGLLLFVNNGSIWPQRFIFSGPHPKNDTHVRTKLELTYTKLD